MRNLMLVGLLSCLPAAGNAQGLVTFTTGFRGKAGPKFDAIHAGPVFGLDVKPIRWGWGALGIELSLAPRITARDSGAYSPAGQGCLGPDGILTTCASSRSASGEGTAQFGLTATFGPGGPRTVPFGELALGYYGTNSKSKLDIWDPTGRHLSNLSGEGTDTKGGVYARVGLGVQVKPWSRGPALALSARYRWAKLGGGLGDWFEWFNDRSGAELVMAVVLR